ncbi:hypothetical protein PoB_001796800 [Plakobranchus ocellatus]|uniref:Uncharacterized protein n=1 Tax=Plakobranchus ocellatus TaxID=259542 RepID=A0AAV3ZAI3_9GAST|nr:hypothetical protein PoB_001796800 [Plakobranchus ocellatus]
MVPPPNELCGIPGLGLVPDPEIQCYIKVLGPAALKSSPTKAINKEHFFGTLPLRQFKILSVAQGPPTGRRWPGSKQPQKDLRRFQGEFAIQMPPTHQMAVLQQQLQ